MGQIWIEKVLKPYVVGASQSFLLIDHFKVHLCSEFVKAANKLGVDIDYIPAGYTCVLQPVDVGVNAPFKRFMRDHHHNWCTKEYPNRPSTAKFPTPGREDVLQWIERSFEMVRADTIVKTFVHIGYISDLLETGPLPVVLDDDSSDLGDVVVNEDSLNLGDETDEEVSIDPAEVSGEVDALSRQMEEELGITFAWMH